jgi:hypothetical protein
MRGKIVTGVILAAFAWRLALAARWLRDNYGGIR